MRSYDRMRDLLSDKPVAFHPQLARLLGGINSALLFQQIAFWSSLRADSKAGYGAWIWKTQSELEDETAMTRYEQEGARRILRREGVVEEKRAGIPARLHYRINWGRFFELAAATPYAPVCGKPAYSGGEDAQPGSRKSSEQERGRSSDRPAETAPSKPEKTNREYPEKTQDKNPVPEASEAEAAWREVVCAFIQAGNAPPWLRPWCVGAELSDSTLRVRLPVSATVNGMAFADLVRDQFGEELERTWRLVSSDPRAELELEAGRV